MSSVLLDKLSTCLYKTETLKLSLWICISEGFSILVLLLEYFYIGIYLDLYTVFSVSVILGKLDLSIDLTVSVLLLFGVSTVLLDAFYFSFFNCVNYYFLQ